MSGYMTQTYGRGPRSRPTPPFNHAHTSPASIADPDAIDNVSLTLPRILCLHGGGTNGNVLRMQARAFRAHLSTHYRLVFADAPYVCDAHEDIIPVYEHHGPFRMWYRWKKDQQRCAGPKKPTIDSDPTLDAYGDDARDGDDIILADIENELQEIMGDDDRRGATGDWIGLLGFSQGARLAGSILYEQQLRLEEAENTHNSAGSTSSPNKALQHVKGFAGGYWRFGVLIAGRGPFIRLRNLDVASRMTEAVGLMPDYAKPHCPGEDSMRYSDDTGERSNVQGLWLPTLHVHGLQDSGLEYSRHWLKTQFLRPALEDHRGMHGARLYEWDGPHRLPFRSVELIPIAKAIQHLDKQ